MQHERLQVTAVRQPEDAADAAREQHVERGLEPAAGGHEGVGDQRQTRTMRVVGGRRGEVGLHGDRLPAGHPLAREDPARQPVQGSADIGRTQRHVAGGRDQMFEIQATQRPERGVGRCGRHPGGKTTGQGVELQAQVLPGAFGRGRLRSHLPDLPAQISSQRGRRNESACEQRAQTLGQSWQRHLRQHETNAVIERRTIATIAKRAVERHLDEARDLGLVGQREAGIEAGLERKLAQQREAERVDGRHRDLVGTIPQRLPHAGVTCPQVGHDAVAHLGGRLARERDGQHVPRVDAGREQREVAVHEHAGLARAGRGLEYHVVARVCRVRASCLIDGDQRGITHHPRSPSGTRWRSRRTGSGTGCGA